MKLQNKAMLITYADSLGHNLKDLSQVMERYFNKAIGGIHLLPIFPSNGDRGFRQHDMMWLILNLALGKTLKNQVSNII